ncbi:MAG: NUDIX domain-containing protein [Candidatus Omnitrophica bacterium]|nr:NUDIX domain-containing protein [Candidatus Omnitrophota bacterium]
MEPHYMTMTMPVTSEEQRKYLRFDTDVKIHFHVPYEFRTEVDFSLKQVPLAEKYIGFSKNISAYGLCFEANKEVHIGGQLWLELHLPESKDIIYMQGIARWCQLSVLAPERPKMYLIGVEVLVVDGVNVEQTTYFDQKYGIVWSELLERVLGSYAQLHKKNFAVTVLRGILKENGRYLMVRRSANCTTFTNKWEFPGGKVIAGEHTSAALKREFQEEVALEIAPLKRFMDFTLERAEGNVEYKIFFVQRVSGEPALSEEHDKLGWFSPEEMRELDISPPLLDVVSRLINES